MDTDRAIILEHPVSLYILLGMHSLGNLQSGMVQGFPKMTPVSKILKVDISHYFTFSIIPE